MKIFGRDRESNTRYGRQAMPAEKYGGLTKAGHRMGEIAGFGRRAVNSLLYGSSGRPAPSMLDSNSLTISNQSPQPSSAVANPQHEAAQALEAQPRSAMAVLNDAYLEAEKSERSERSGYLAPGHRFVDSYTAGLWAGALHAPLTATMNSIHSTCTMGTVMSGRSHNHCYSTNSAWCVTCGEHKPTYTRPHGSTNSIG